MLRQTRERALGAYGHSELPFERLVAELAPERDPSRTPLFQAMFVLHDARSVSETSTVGGIQQFATGTSKFDLTLSFSETADSAGRADRVQHGSVRGGDDPTDVPPLRHAAGGDGRCAGSEPHALPMLTAEDRSRCWGSGTRRRWSIRSGSCLHQLLAEQAQRTPEQVATVFGEASISYGELDRRSNRLAQHLRALGVGPDVLIGLLVERSLEMVVGLLGILKAGGAYVPLDPAFPANRLAYMIENSRMQHPRHPPWTGRGACGASAGGGPPGLGRGADRGLRGGDCRRLPGMSPERLAYVLYTSGSTGKPKGVAIPHSAIVNFLCSMQREPGFSSDDTLLAVTTLSFDIAGLELFLPLLCGGRVAIAGRPRRRTRARLMERIRAVGMHGAAGHAGDVARPARCRLAAASPKLKVLCGGEALLPDLAEALLARCGELWNMYGPTETTVWSALHRVSAAEGPIAIGQPIANTQLYVLDAHAQPGCRRVCRASCTSAATAWRAATWHREELTAESVSSPARLSPGARLYRTGDLARWLADGTLECLGRVDNQVKMRGFRIELGEIEAVLSAYPGIRQCTVVLAPDAAGGGQLAAYYETVGYETAGYESERAGARARAGDDGPAEIPAAELRAHLSKELPPYMVPGVFVAMAKLPLTPNGKIDRKALAASTGELVVEREFVAPRNEIEQLLAQIWARRAEGEPGGHGGQLLRTGRPFAAGGAGGAGDRKALPHPPAAGGTVAVAHRGRTRCPAAAAAVAAVVVVSGAAARPGQQAAGVPDPCPWRQHAGVSHAGQSAGPGAAGLRAAGAGAEWQDRLPILPLEEMASTYVEEIRSMQPEGPYYPGGLLLRRIAGAGGGATADGGRRAGSAAGDDPDNASARYALPRRDSDAAAMGPHGGQAAKPGVGEPVLSRSRLYLRAAALCLGPSPCHGGAGAASGAGQWKPGFFASADAVHSGPVGKGALQGGEKVRAAPLRWRCSALPR